jgi:heat shock protein HtpX
MATAISAHPWGLVFARMAENRFKTWLIVALTVLALAPFVAGVSYGIANSIVVRVRPDGRKSRDDVRRAEFYLHSESSTMDAETRQYWERAIQQKRAALDQDEAGNGDLLIELIALFSAVQMGALGLLFWSIAASPTAKLLVEAGAFPSGPGEREARESLETLALSAGMPVPKLFVIESSVPNAFAAGVPPHQSVVAVTRGALMLLDQSEIEAVLAHELSHIGNHDVQLNAVVAAIALFLRIPYLLFQRELRAGKHHVDRRRNPWRLALSPVGVYILFVAPVVGAVIRAAVSRKRELEADADAARLTGSPQGLLRALAKIGGSGSVVAGSNPAFAHFYFANPAAAGGWLGGDMVATHPSMAERVQMLAAGQDRASVEKLREAIEAGRRYSREHPGVQSSSLVTVGAQDELASFNRGNPMGRVYRLMASAPVPVYETSRPNSPVLARVKPGALLVAFADGGKMRQVNTADQTFGYIDRSVKLVAMDVLIPDEVYSPAARAAAEAALPALDAVPAPEPAPKKQPQGLTTTQILVAVGVGALVFGGMFLALMKFGI